MTLTLSTILFIAVGTLIYRQIAALLRRPSVPLDWTPDLSVDRYRPMFRLLSEGDISFLRSQPGATPALVRRLRKRRCQVFRGYVQSLERDFHGALKALSLVMVQSQSDRRDIARTLIVSRLRFSLAVYRVRFRLLVYRWNMGQEPVTHMMNLFEGLQRELAAMAETPTATPQPS
jgi:hypothetical protein